MADRENSVIKYPFVRFLCMFTDLFVYSMPSVIPLSCKLCFCLGLFFWLVCLSVSRIIQTVMEFFLEMGNNLLDFFRGELDSNPRICFSFYPRDAMPARVFATATCPSVRPDVRLSHAGIVPSRAKAGS